MSNRVVRECVLFVRKLLLCAHLTSLSCSCVVCSPWLSARRMRALILHSHLLTHTINRRVRAAYMAAAPVVLRALNLGYLPDAHQVAASRDGNDR